MTPRTVAIMSTWNNATWIESSLKWALPFFDRVIVQEANWTSEDRRWAGDTSPDGTAALIRAFPDPEGKLEFYQLGRWEHGCLAARAQLCSRIPPCDWVYVLDADEFLAQSWLDWLAENLSPLKRKGYTTISQHTRGFYWDFTRHTVERFTRWFRWYPGINCWGAQYARPGDFGVPEKFNTPEPSRTRLGREIYHYSYVPIQAVEIKGAQSFDVSLERYQHWYHQVLLPFDGEHLEPVYAQNQGGVHVFGGGPVTAYAGEHPEALADHPLRFARWRGPEPQYQHAATGQPIPLSGWWGR